MNLILCGPPGVGKTTVGRLVAERLGRAFVDGDAWIEQRWGRAVADYFASDDEALFRAREAEACRAWSALSDQVIAPGGGALLDPRSRAALEASGSVMCLTAPTEALLARLNGSHARPLLGEDPRQRLADLLRARGAHYGSFWMRVETGERPPEVVADEVSARFAEARDCTVLSVGEGVAIGGKGMLERLPEFLRQRDLRSPYALISDTNVAPLYGPTVGRSLSTDPIVFAAGEASKALEVVHRLYGACLQRGLERGGTLLTLGGGVVGDVGGFVAATYMRGVRWANLPTTVLAMADASLGGKVGVDLPEGKNLVGAFHPPALILADFDTLATLPEVERRSGLAEVVKAGIIGDPHLFEGLGRGHLHLEAMIVRAAAVKAGIVNADPTEQGERAALNFGHTVGHAIEAASGFRVPHGPAVAMGMAAEARLAELLGMASAGLAAEIAGCLAGLGLPTRTHGLTADQIREGMRSDKKRAQGRLKFALPREIGTVEWGVEADEASIMRALHTLIGEAGTGARPR